MKKQNALLILVACFLATSVCFTSCKKDDDTDPVVTPIDTTDTIDSTALITKDVFITCEGPFAGGTGTLTKVNLAAMSVQNNAFETVNGYPLGNIVQSVSVFNDRAYIVVNNAHKIEVVNASTLVSVGQITGLTYPRNFLGISDTKAYVTEWGTTQGKVMVIDLQTLAVTDSITCSYGTECLIKKGNFVYVTNGGDFVNSSNSVTVIDTQTDQVTTTIPVGTNPTGIVTDADGKIWVLCNGTFGNLDGSLVRISTLSNTADLTIPTQLDYYQARLTTNKAKNKLYFSVGDKTFAHNISATTFDNNPWLTRGFYGLETDLKSNILYAADPRDYISNGWILRYDLNTSAVIDSFETGNVPGNFFFN